MKRLLLIFIGLGIVLIPTYIGFKFYIWLTSDIDEPQNLNKKQKTKYYYLETYINHKDLFLYKRIDESNSILVIENKVDSIFNNQNEIIGFTNGKYFKINLKTSNLTISKNKLNSTPLNLVK